MRLSWCPYAPLCSYIFNTFGNPHTCGHPQYVQSFNRIFIWLYHKKFSYFRGSHGELSDLGGVHLPPMFIHPHTFGHPPYIWTPPIFQRVLIGYLFCYIIKCFPTLEAVVGGCQT